MRRREEEEKRRGGGEEEEECGMGMRQAGEWGVEERGRIVGEEGRRE